MKLTKEMIIDDLQNRNIETLRYLHCIVLELEAAQEKHPAWTKDHIHAAAIVGEEAGELIRAALLHKYKKGPYYHMHNEAIQTAAMCVRMLINLPDKSF